MKKFTFLICSVLCLGDIQAQSLSVTTSITNNVSCYGGSNGAALATASGGTTPYTYSWAPGGQTTAAISGLIAGTYTVNVTDFAANTATATVTISQPTAPLSITASAKYSVVCPGSSDSLYVTGSGGTTPYSYLWNGPFGDISCDTCQKTNAYPYGNPYIVTAVNDYNGCTASASVSITVHPFPYVTITGPLSPIPPGQHDTLVALAMGATSYLWSNSSTTTSIIVMPSSPTTYKVTATNIYGCYDTAHYSIYPNNSGNGKSSSNAISVSPSTNLTTISYSSLDSCVWFSFVAQDSNNQIISNSNFMGVPVPHVHRLTLYDNSLNTIMDEDMPDIIGANQIRLDISHLDVGSTYYVRVARTPANVNMPGNNPTPTPIGVDNASQRWDFQMCFRSVPVFVPNDSASEPPAVDQLYYEGRGQIEDLNKIPRFDIKAYTNNTYPAVYASDSAVSFVYQHVDTAKSFIDTLQRIDMVLTGSSLQPFQPVFKMQEDSGAGYLNYFLGFVPNGVPKVEGYSRLVYKNVYPNTDMEIYSNNEGTKLYFVCNPAGGGSPAGNPANIELKFKGANSVSITGGKLSVATELGNLNFAPGFAYTDSAGIIKPKSWQAYFITVNSNTVRFNTGAYNGNEPLIIQVDRGHNITNSNPPIENLDWSTYFGGVTDYDQFYDVCSDVNGNIYATGATQSSDYPVTPGVVQDSLYRNNANNITATVAKFNDSDARVWATYYGGGYLTIGYGICVDAIGNVYITGGTQSSNLPFATRPSSPHNYVQYLLNNTPNDPNSWDAFITMFSSDGTETYWATYYGGANASEQGNHITVDGNSNLYVVGGGVDPSEHTTFPLKASTQPGAYNDSTYGTGFILEFNVSAPRDSIYLEWATRIGDTNHSTDVNFISTATLMGCKVDASNNFYVTGIASGYGYTSPTVPTFPYQGVYNQIQNAVVTKFNSTNQIDWSSYYGGNQGEVGNAITVDQTGNVYITGNSFSDSIVTGIGIETKKLSTGFFQRYNGDGGGGSGNGYIAEFSSSGSLEWGTYFGGAGYLSGEAISIDAYNDLYIIGDNSTMPLPGSNPANTYSQRTFVSGNIGDDAFVAAFSDANTYPDYVWGTYFGNDQATGICLSNSNGYNWLYMVGNIGNGNTPQVYPTGAYRQPNYFFTPPVLGTSFISQFNIGPIIGPAGISNLPKYPNGITVYPNPTMQDITVQMELIQNQDVEFILYNSMGKVVYDKKLSEQAGIISQQIDLSLLSNGIYLLKVDSGNTYDTQKIIKQN